MKNANSYQYEINYKEIGESMILLSEKQTLIEKSHKHQQQVLADEIPDIKFASYT